MCMVHIALQDFKAITLMLCRMAFQSSDKEVALHLDNDTKKFFYVIEVVQHNFFFCRLGCCILNLHNKHGIALIAAYIPTHLSV